MNPIVQTLLIALIIMMIFGIIAAIVMNNKAARRRNLMGVIQGRNSAESVKKADGNTLQDKRRADLAKKLKEGGGKEKGKKNTLKDQLQQAGFKISAKQYWIRSLVFAVLFTLVIKILGMNSFVVLMAFVVGLLGLPRFFMKWKTKRRQKKFLEEFADALEAMVRLLKAGMPVAEAISMVGREYTGPVGEEMGKIYDAQKIGVSMPEACLEAAQRMPLTEMQMFATGVTIQQQTGASLSEVLLNIAGVIRARYKLKRKIKSLSSEAKASAMIIGALPIVVASGIYFINPEYIMVLFTDPTGKLMLAGAGFWMMMGVVCMKMMINFKV